MTKLIASALMLTCVLGALAGPASAAPAKRVPMYEATTCHMLYTPAQAKSYRYVCPGSHSKMKAVMVTPAAARIGMAATAKELAGMKKKS